MTTATLDPRTMPWHQLGTVLPEGTTSAEDALRLSGLADWNVRKQSLLTEDGLAVPGKYATVRDTASGDTEVLGVVGEQFHIVQNEDHIGFLDALVDETGAEFDSAGTTTGSEETYISMRLPSTMRILGESDPHDIYVTALNSHVGSRSFTLMITPVRVICTNMQSVALGRASNTIRIRHTSGVGKFVVDEARQSVDRIFAYLEDFQKQADSLATKKMSETMFRRRVEKLFHTESTAPHVVARMDAKVDEMMSLFAEANTQAPIRNTAWAGYNTLVEYYDHLSETRGDDPDRARALNSVLSPSPKKQALALVA